MRLDRFSAYLRARKPERTVKILRDLVPGDKVNTFGGEVNPDHWMKTVKHVVLANDGIAFLHYTNFTNSVDLRADDPVVEAPNGYLVLSRKAREAYEATSA